MASQSLTALSLFPWELAFHGDKFVPKIFLVIGSGRRNTNDWDTGARQHGINKSVSLFGLVSLMGSVIQFNDGLRLK